MSILAKGSGGVAGKSFCCVVNHLNKVMQAAKLKGARVLVTGISNAIAETIVDLGIDWSGIETLSDLQTGLIRALNNFGLELSNRAKQKPTRSGR